MLPVLDTNPLPFDVDFDYADDVMMTSLLPVLDTNPYSGTCTDMFRRNSAI